MSSQRRRKRGPTRNPTFDTNRKLGTDHTLIDHSTGCDGINLFDNFNKTREALEKENFETKKLNGKVTVQLNEREDDDLIQDNENYLIHNLKRQQ